MKPQNYYQPIIHSSTNTGLPKSYFPDSYYSTKKSVDGLEITVLEYETDKLWQAENELQRMILQMPSKSRFKIFIRVSSEGPARRSLDSAHSTKKKVEASPYIPRETDTIALAAEKKETLSTL